VNEVVGNKLKFELSGKVGDVENDVVGLKLGAVDVDDGSGGKSVGDREREVVAETIELLVGFIEGASVGSFGDDVGDPVNGVVGNELSEIVGGDDNNVGDFV